MKADAVASPSCEAFADAYESGGAVVWTRRVSDLETPVSALLKLGPEQPGAFLLESVQGGDFRGRFSIIGLKPDLIWRVRDGQAEISFGPFLRFHRHGGPASPLESLREILRASALALPPELPPMAAGLFGYLGYDMVRFMEKLPDKTPDPIGSPDALLVRPTVICVFDNVTSEITLVTPARAPNRQSASQAYEAARERLARIERALDRPLPKRRAPAAPSPAIEPRSNTTPADYRALVETCKAYARAGDVFQVVPSQRFTAAFAETPY